MIYKIMPRVKIRWYDVWLGAAVTALFTVGRFLYWPLYWKERDCFRLWRRRIVGHHFCVGVLLRADISARRRVHLGLCAHARINAKISMRRRSRRIRASGKFHRAAKDEANSSFSAPIAFMREPASPRPMWVTVGAGAALLLTLNYIASRVFERIRRELPSAQAIPPTSRAQDSRAAPSAPPTLARTACNATPHTAACLGRCAARSQARDDAGQHVTRSRSRQPTLPPSFRQRAPSGAAINVVAPFKATIAFPSGAMHERCVGGCALDVVLVGTGQVRELTRVRREDERGVEKVGARH